MRARKQTEYSRGGGGTFPERAPYATARTGMPAASRLFLMSRIE